MTDLLTVPKRICEITRGVPFLTSTNHTEYPLEH